MEAPVVSRADLSTRAESTIRAVGNIVQRDGSMSWPDAYSAHDVHGFFGVTGPENIVLHVQIYPGMSSDREMQVYARLMDGEKLAAIRRAGEVSPGNEHEATLKVLPGFEPNTRRSWDEVQLAKDLAAAVKQALAA